MFAAKKRGTDSKKVSFQSCRSRLVDGGGGIGDEAASMDLMNEEKKCVSTKMERKMHEKFQIVPGSRGGRHHPIFIRSKFVNFWCKTSNESVSFLRKKNDKLRNKSYYFFPKNGEGTKAFDF